MINKLSSNPFPINHFLGGAPASIPLFFAGFISIRFGACKHSFQPDTWENKQIIEIDHESAGIVSNVSDQAEHKSN
jgi:hypothetical protein